MDLKIALTGNPNSGKTTLFNALTGSNQYIGNWPGVTVEKKEGRLKSNKDVIVTDLPGVYSLSPYTLEEIITRDYLINEKPDVIVNIVDATNLERNLYLTTQLTELGIPVVIALNMIDVVRRNGDTINLEALSSLLSCEVVEISAATLTGIDNLLSVIPKAAERNASLITGLFEKEVDEAISSIALPESVTSFKRFYQIKLFERDARVLEIYPSTDLNEATIKAMEFRHEDDAQSIIINARYDYIGRIISECIERRRPGHMTTSDKIDRIVTNRILALPLFFFVMSLVYLLAVTTIGAIVTEWTNETLFSGFILENLRSALEGWGAYPWLTGLVVDGIVGGVGAVIGFVPQMLILFFLLALLEECGYMARIAFIMDRAFRKFGLTGKSFIPMLIGTGCGVPAVMASRTIENEQDRRMSIMTTTFMPCGAKMPIVGLIAGAVFGGVWWVAPSAYVLGIATIIFSGIILKKTKMFAGDPSPFVMELPMYHLPRASSVLRTSWDRGFSFVKRAGSVILLASIGIWLLANFDFRLNMVDSMDASILAKLGSLIAPIFKPLGFGTWQATVATIMGLIAKEEVVGVFGVLFGVGDEALSLIDNGVYSELSAISAAFTFAGAYSFLVFNLLCAPCFAAIGAIKKEMNNAKWTVFAISYQCIVAYAVALCFYQFANFFSAKGFTFGTFAALVVLCYFIYMVFRKPTKHPTLPNTEIETA
jgi:ferrous iron transport protein B